MNQVQPYLLWLGHAGDGRDFQKLMDLGIAALVQVGAEEPPAQPPREIISARFPLIDGTGNRIEVLKLAVGTVVSLLKLRVPTLVCCGAGMSRSPAIAAAALSVAYDEPPEHCLERVARVHPHDVSPGLWSDILRALPLG
jgi:hypothetical protein